MSSFKMVYGKACHLPVELEHKAYWAIKKLNFDAQLAEKQRLLDLNEIEEIRVQAYENAKLYKENTKKWHDRMLLPRHFHIGHSTVTSQPRFVDEVALERFQNLKNRRVFFELGFVFSNEEVADLGSDVLDIVHQHKWNKFVRHPQNMNASLNITDNHTTFTKEADNETYHGILENLCLSNIQWNGQQMSHRTVDRERLQPRAKLWNHFMKYKLLPNSHNTTVSCQRMLLLHSIIVGSSIDIGKIIVEQVHTYLKRHASALVFPNLITALCRKKKVPEEQFDEIFHGMTDLIKAKIPMLLGLKEAKGKEKEENNSRDAATPHARRRDEFLTNAFMEILPHTNFNITVFPATLLHTSETVKASEEAHQPGNEEVHQPADEEEPTDPDLFHTISPTEHQEEELQLAPPVEPMEKEQPEMSQQVPLRRSRCRLKKVSKRKEHQLSTVSEGPSTPPAAPASDSEHSNPAQLRKRTRCTTVAPPQT
ncbi:Detected protein of unknown function [Hibiscus syriacus]|uniref:Putative plant transposon protein domain-containing protein n=1 Tax=Hibiscus syriacus TaxID=106335 RepID=A0A6A3AN19_HIBSY|nr:Detected protein of unknown function [Hibiscus syriacus]